jgi:Lrp/AsnC family leucine-responsive transcriptional regulator
LHAAIKFHFCLISSNNASSSLLEQYAGARPGLLRTYEEAGVITKYVSLLDQEKVGFPVTAYVSVAIEKSAAKLAAFERTLRSCEEVMECYLMTGAFDYIVRVVASDMAGIERFVMTRLATIEGVRDVSTSITLRRVQYKTVLPVREGGE